MSIYDTDTLPRADAINNLHDHHTVLQKKQKALKASIEALQHDLFELGQELGEAGFAVERIHGEVPLSNEQLGELYAAVLGDSPEIVDDEDDNYEPPYDPNKEPYDLNPEIDFGDRYFDR